MRRLGFGLGTLAAALALVLIGVGTTVPAARALTNCTVTSTTLDGEESAFLTLINNYRATNGLTALGNSTNLNRAAEWLAVDMGTKAYFSHTDSLGRSPSTRATDCGYPGGAGENIAAGTAWDTAQEAFNAWKASAGHNANMLNSSYKQIGVARAYTAGSPYSWYWVTDFGLVNDGTSGGGTPPPTPVKAALTAPTPSSVLTGATVTFNWSAGTSAQEYMLYVGTSTGSSSLYGASAGLNRSATVGGLPTDGRKIYARLWTRFSTGWQYTDYTYTAAGGTATTVKAAMTAPVPGSTIRGGTSTFSWSAGNGALEYYLYVGTAAGRNNLYGRSQGLSRSVTLSGLPTSGTLYVRLWTRFAGGWQYTDYTYTAAR
ncbi:MAG: CAP domain-containing protein [Dehalococcoidia bacterium]|nr:CAP domain-containing protein [Dehalococcoidia bacterium]